MARSDVGPGTPRTNFPFIGLWGLQQHQHHQRSRVPRTLVPLYLGPPALVTWADEAACDFLKLPPRRPRIVACVDQIRFRVDRSECPTSVLTTLMRLRGWRIWTYDRNRQLVAGTHAGIGSSASQTNGCVGCVIRKAQRVICSGCGPALKTAKADSDVRSGPRHGNELGGQAWTAKLTLSTTSSLLSPSKVVHKSRDPPRNSHSMPSALRFPSLHVALLLAFVFSRQ